LFDTWYLPPERMAEAMPGLAVFTSKAKTLLDEDFWSPPKAKHSMGDAERGAKDLAVIQAAGG
jgi:hypothetical protein